MTRRGVASRAHRTIRPCRKSSHLRWRAPPGHAARPGAAEAGGRGREAREAGTERLGRSWGATRRIRERLPCSQHSVSEGKLSVC